MMRFTDLKRRHSQRGLTLYELLIVLAILAMLATLIAPRVVGYLGRAKSDTAKTQLANIATSLELYYYDQGQYPSPDQGLAALVTKPADAPRWNGPYLQASETPLDPWGRPYRYRTVDEAGRGFEIVSLGADGAEGGDGENADIRSK